ncbi:DUF3042 family protein [Lapidilactobacillus mulanensis]|uniref:DUF3042 family protein n=1 Tax=Lapidilactobacillus mulanensis TaxID=2485999 RepID=A0ABW4DQG8_9LACO|nr:DUF3042 family protein [Lapidilactobacillus mulanensis]
MAKHFVKGLLIGSLTTLGAVAGSLYAFKKAVIEPQEEFDSKVEDNRRRANRKSHAAHQG